ncbi:uncharacterized protein F4812DRAFT_227557 [Daldinia caldariorum]|uniref:uncharacterized protein n=1 Tax=Daldinia caldariorum TaxID=326644 RepID=UPI00200897DB|nr:uncharacterized protein F4812DRAFT_227557 [Daldinia caldariorum]KAI1463928.1 hypothetical protein F4812DRAFT_227557 [Daldinia caldariorum]
MSVPPGGWVCNCWAATLRIISQSEKAFRPQSSSSGQQLSQSMSISDVLTLSRNLLQHWELLNGCASSDTHLNPLVFRLIADAVSRILTLHELAFQALSKEDAPDITEAGTWQSPDGGTNLDIAGNVVPQIRNTIPICISSLELDDKEEIAIVCRETLKHSTMRLGAILQDIEEESRQFDRDQLTSVNNPLRDKEIRELIGRLFRILGRAN